MYVLDHPSHDFGVSCCDWVLVRTAFEHSRGAAVGHFWYVAFERC